MSDQNNSAFTELPEDAGLDIDSIFGSGSSADADLPPIEETPTPAADNQTIVPKSPNSPANPDTPVNTDNGTSDTTPQTQNTVPADSPQEPSVDASPKYNGPRESDQGAKKEREHGMMKKR